MKFMQFPQRTISQYKSKLVVNVPYVLATLVLGVFVSSCAASKIVAGGTSTQPVRAEMVMQFGWADCKTPGDLYFSVDLSPDGGGRYEGLRGVRSLDSRSLAVPAEGMSRLMSAARQLKGAKESEPSNDNDQSAHSRYCLIVRFEDGRSVSVTTNLNSLSASNFTLVANEVTKFRSYVCPGRDFNFFGERGGCPAASVILVYDENSSCRVRHVVHLYGDGTMHYYSEDVDGSDQYSQQSPDHAEKMRRMAESFTVVRREGLSGDEPVDYRGTQSELDQFRSALESSYGVKWPTLEVGDRRCLKSVDATQLQRWILL